MSRSTMVLAGTALIVISFLGGIWYNARSRSSDIATERKPTYYACPMHPGYQSDQPGDAPCCGMRLEPVYAKASSNHAAAGTSSGGIHLNSAQLHMGGIRVERAVRQATRRTLRTTGRVAADENRLYRINASTEMWLRKVYPPTTGTPVAKDEALCGFYTTNFLTAAQSYIYILDATDRLTAAGQNSTAQTASNDLQLRQAVELLQNLGVSQAQIRDMAETRKASALVDVRSPVDGYILSRKVTLGQWLPPGSELYEIADLAGVWVYADLFESEAWGLRPGTAARIWSPTLKLEFSATVSGLPPAFDASSRQLRLRLNVDNPKRVLWPGMFVDVEVTVETPPSITVPAAAIIYSGHRNLAYVMRGEGYFEPRPVHVGWTAGDLIQITHGLEEGEDFVVSANFLLDSESRMRKGPALAANAARVKDPVCGMDVDPASPVVRKSEHPGGAYYFCSQQCKASFDQNSGKYIPKKEPDSPGHATDTKAAKKGPA